MGNINVKELHEYLESRSTIGPCACLGPRDGESLCPCAIRFKQESRQHRLDYVRSIKKPSEEGE